MIEKQQIRQILEGALLAYGQPLSVDKLHSLFVTETVETDEGNERPVKADVSKEDINHILEEIQNDCDGLGYELKKVASGWRFQVRAETAPWVNKLWDEKPQRYSRALMETLAIIAYRQPITRGDIEEIRGVAVSSHIIKTLSEREWVKVVGQRDVPGRPSLYATTKPFLDYFNISSLEELPSLRELTDIDSLTPELDLAGKSTVAVSENANAQSDSSDSNDEQIDYNTASEAENSEQNNESEVNESGIAETDTQGIDSENVQGESNDDSNDENNASDEQVVH